jgi:molybdenum cofactor synthesis domain-containing protein
VLESVDVLAPRSVPVAGALGCVLAEDIRSAEDVPPFANTAMDGYAVRAADVVGASDGSPAVLPVVAEVAAGHAAPRALEAGEAMRIFTGAPMPPGADAVIMVERTERLDGGDKVAVHEAVESGTHVRGAGDDVRAGTRVFEAGEMLTPAHIGVLASFGCTGVTVVPRPTVGVLSTGDELVEGGAPLAPGQIRETNRVALLAALRESGFDTSDLGIARDDEQLITSAIERGVESCDAVLTSGGVSMGDIDLVKVVLDTLTSGGMRWMQVAIRPAKPFAFGVVERGRDRRRVPVFGLPGNPVSSLVSYELLARPALCRMAGRPRLDRSTVPARASRAFRRRPDGKTHFVRVMLSGGPGEYEVEEAGAQGSHQLTALARANGLAVLPDGDGVDAGESVDVLVFGFVP